MRPFLGMVQTPREMKETVTLSGMVYSYLVGVQFLAMVVKGAIEDDPPKNEPEKLFIGKRVCERKRIGM